ncbi:MAG: DUF4388 domain-containing protein [Acidobacteriota bacterium]|nr:DUF4388 domain-containing protein [Acidobacteriota bacterium]
MALEGSLRDFDLFSLFNMIKIQGKSGTLVLSRGQEFVKVFFDQGEIVGCDSNQVRLEDRVGTMLVRLGRLSGEELMQIVQLQRQTLKLMGTLLLESGKVTAQDLQDALFNQAMAIIYRTFRWKEGDYRFDSMLPLDLDREHFPPIPVDTVLMEAARIQDEWPEVQKRLPDLVTPLAKTAKGQGIKLDIDRELSTILDGSGGSSSQGSSGLSHEQETVLTYFEQAQSVQDVLLVSRYEELDTCKTIADLLEAGLLEPIRSDVNKPSRPWTAEDAPDLEKSGEPEGPSKVFWPWVAALILFPLLTYVPRSRASLNQGLASLQPADLRDAPDVVTRIRQDWALRMASPVDGGLALAKALGRPIPESDNPVMDLTRYPDPLFAPYPKAQPAEAEAPPTSESKSEPARLANPAPAKGK